MSKYCSVCGARCNGKLQLVLGAKGALKIACTECFDKTTGKTATEIRKMIRRASLH